MCGCDFDPGHERADCESSCELQLILRANENTLLAVLTGCAPCRCVVDYKPRKFDAECCNILANFAEMVVRDAERYAAEDEPDGLHRHIALKQVRLVALSRNEAAVAPVCMSAHRVSACFLRLPLRCDTWNLTGLVCSTH